MDEARKRRGARRRQSAAAALVLVMLLPAFAPVTEAFPGSGAGFFDGSLTATVTVANPGERQWLGALRLPSNATVTAASLDLAPTGVPVSANVTDNYASGFLQGAAGTGAAVTPAAVTLAKASGSTEFSGALLAGGTFESTYSDGLRVWLTGTSGAYTSPAIKWNNVSYGRLISGVAIPPGATVAYSVVSSAGDLLQSGLAPGDLITVDGRAYPSVAVRADMTKSAAGQRPSIARIGAGYASEESGRAAAGQPAQAGAVRNPGGIELRQSLTNLTEYAGNPLLNAPTGSWYTTGLELGSAIVVQDETWLYMFGEDASGKTSVGRAVSADGGANWTIDASPVIAPTPSTWDSGWVGEPYVLIENGTFVMYYGGAVTYDAFSIGRATSTDGVTWTKDAGNPVFTPEATGWDDHAVGWPHVVKVDSTYYLYFSGRVSTDARKSIGLATSPDGIAWTRIAGNPINAWGSTTWGAYETAVNDVLYEDGIFYIYWTCASDAVTYNTCLSTSTGGTNLTHYAGNPIITMGDGPWDNMCAQSPTWATDPQTGRRTVFFVGYTTTFAKSIARADPDFENPGQAQVTFDLAGEVPAAFEAAGASAGVPAGTTAALSLAASADGLTYGAEEPLDLSDSTVATSPDRYARFTVAETTSDRAATPSVYSLRLDYSRFAPGGAFVSRNVSQPAAIRDATVTWTATQPAGTQVALEVSNDGGASWKAAQAGVKATFTGGGTDFRYRLQLNGTSARAPEVSEVRAAFALDANPADLRVETEAGVTLASLTGELTASTHVALNESVLNDVLAPLAATDPPYDVAVDLYVNASSRGSLTASNLSLTYTVPDLLHASFAPVGDALDMDEGASQLFSVDAWTTPGVSIVYAWWIDGTAAGSSANLTFDAPVAALGAHTVKVLVTNGQFALEHTWNVTVAALPGALVVAYAPRFSFVDLTEGQPQEFSLDLGAAAGTATVAWTLDGVNVGQGPSVNLTGQLTAGTHTVRAAVTEGPRSSAVEWIVAVAPVPPPPPPPPGALVVVFAPAGDLVIHEGQTAVFRAALQGTSPPSATTEWQIFGGLQGRVGKDNFTVVGLAPGTYSVWVTVRAAAGETAHVWNLTVLPSAAAAGPGATPAKATTAAPDATGAATVAAAAALGVAVAVYSIRRRRGRGP